MERLTYLSFEYKSVKWHRTEFLYFSRINQLDISSSCHQHRNNVRSGDGRSRFLLQLGLRCYQHNYIFRGMRMEHVDHGKENEFLHDFQKSNILKSIHRKISINATDIEVYFNPIATDFSKLANGSGTRWWRHWGEIADRDQCYRP